jgi:hypothetical protein
MISITAFFYECKFFTWTVRVDIINIHLDWIVDQDFLLNIDKVIKALKAGERDILIDFSTQKIFALGI